MAALFVDDLTDYTHFHLGQFCLVYERVNLETLLEECCEIYKRKALEKQILINIDSQPD
jgi:signal transduction histidine kinase